MWSKGKRKQRVGRIDTLVGEHTSVEGDVTFSGGLHVDGKVRGNVSAPDDSESTLTLSEHGQIEGDVRVPYIVLNGVISGNVHAAQRIELAPKARVTGDVIYNLIEMAMGAEVNGSLVHNGESRAQSTDQQRETPASSGLEPEPDNT